MFSTQRRAAIVGVYTTGQATAHMFWAEQLGERPVTFLDIGLASGGVAKGRAGRVRQLVQRGRAVLGQGRLAARAARHGGPGPGPAGRGVQLGAGRRLLHTWYALWAQRYMHEFGVTSEDMAEVAVTHRYHATLNPASIMGRHGAVSVADVIGSRMVADPLHLLDCAIDNDGGYAIVIAAEDVARDCRKPPIWVLGGAEAAYTTIDVLWFPEDGKAVRRTADMAFGIAGVSRDDIDVGGLYDCFTVTMLRGECGERQVPEARIGISLAQGMAVHGQAGTLIMARN